jgi:hypothetical protein
MRTIQRQTPRISSRVEAKMSIFPKIFSVNSWSAKSILSRIDLQREKQKDYRNIVITQVVLITAGLTLYGPLLENTSSGISKLLITLFSIFALIYAFLLWDLLRNFTENSRLIVAVLLTLIGISVLGLLTEFPYYKLIETQNKQAVLLVIHGLLFPIEVLVITYAIRDIFMSQYFTPDKLWGSACVFLMIGISFGSIFDLICISNPGSLGIPIELGLPNYSECVSYSFHVLGGIDTDYPDANRLIKNISVIEAVWGNLFTVLIIGKLMILPKPPEAKS